MTARELDERLSLGEGAVTALFAAWGCDEIQVRLQGLGSLAFAGRLGAKIRGAFGDVLLESASPAVRERRPCDWLHACSAEYFFGRRPRIPLGDHASEITAPFVLSWRTEADEGSVVGVERLEASPWGKDCSTLPEP